jgi:RNA polymerase sigma factor (sigma-70 family)
MGSLTQLEVLLPELRAYARSICERPDAAEDLVQDAIERTLKSENPPNALSSLRPWMFRVIRNLHFDELRKLRVRREYLTREKRLLSEGGEVPDHARDVFIRLGYERLPPEKREVLFLVDIMGLKYAEAADVMGVATGTVMSRLSRARQALRRIVDPRQRGDDAQLSGTRDR